MISEIRPITPTLVVLAVCSGIAILLALDAALQLRLWWKTRRARRIERRVVQARYANTQAGETR